MSATLAYNDLVPQASALPETAAVTKKPGFFARMLEEIGKAYYVPTPDGQGAYIFPSI